MPQPQNCVHIGDRESDIYELFCLAEELGTKFLVRTCVIGGIFDAFGLGQRPQVGLPVGTGVFAHDAFHRGVGFQRGGVNRQSLAAQHAFFLQQPQRKDEDLVINRFGQALADDRHRGMDGGRLAPTDSQKGAQREAVGAAPGDAALGVNAFKVTDEEHAEVSARRNSRPSPLLVIGPAECLGEVIETALGQDLIELVVKRMTRPGGQLDAGDEQFVLLGLAFAECHVFQTRQPLARSNQLKDFFNGLLGLDLTSAS
jgi:hypothetical protein